MPTVIEMNLFDSFYQISLILLGIMGAGCIIMLMIFLHQLLSFCKQLEKTTSGLPQLLADTKDLQKQTVQLGEELNAKKKTWQKRLHLLGSLLIFLHIKKKHPAS